MSSPRSKHRTRILATLGPACWDEDSIEKMVLAGATAFRLNFSHGSHEDHALSVRRVRDVAERLGVAIALLQDLQGPKIRTGPLLDGDPMLLRVGEAIRVTHQATHTGQGVIATTYEHLVTDVKVGDSVRLDDGLLELRCIEQMPGEIICEVLCGGLLRANKGINLPGVNVSTPSLTKKDRTDLAFGLEQKVDYVALSFVRSAGDVVELQELITSLGHSVGVIAKIEKPEAVFDIKNILEVADGIMVARGDLGVEVPSERLPVLQKEIIAAARQRGRVVITATQMLESMTENPRPTRAETSDVANAILDGTDAVMLSGETATGKHPIEAVATMARIAGHTEGSELYRQVMGVMRLDPGGDIADATVHAASTAARELSAGALIAFSSSGRTCFKVSFSRPPTRIIGSTFSARIFQRLALCWGVEPVLLKEASNIEELYFFGERHILEHKLIDAGELTVVITGSNVGGGGTNSIKIHRVGTIDMTDDPEVAARFRRLYKRLGIPAEVTTPGPK
ncbi:MAG: pyruvate kinase [Planctomycetes bacterium]|nr:pyruvate kinase [Planctomycetota bacterium]